MKNSRLLFAIICSVFLLNLSACSLLTSQGSAKWAYEFAVWNGDIYKVSNNYTEEINKEIGQVTKYLDYEGESGGNPSNKYEKGTKYYSIKGVDPKEAIAIQEKDGRYRKATNDGRYAGK